jgi:cytoskeletal protein CcmA (bactofilin family)
LRAEQVPEENAGGVFVLPAGMVIEGDYFASGGAVEISGLIRGDLYVIGKQVFVDGVVEGDVLAAGGSVDLSGRVGGNIRVLGGQVALSGEVGRSGTVVAGNVDFSPSARIGENLVCVAGNADLAAPIGHDLTLIASNARLSSSTERDVSAYVGQMRLTSKAVVGGQLDYRSNTQAYIDPGARILGKLVHHPSLVHDLFQGKWMQGLLIGSQVATTLMNFFYTFVIGFLLIRVFPHNLEETLHVMDRKPWKALSYGLMLLLLLPLASLVLLMTILGVPFALTLIALNIVGFYTAKTYSILWISNKWLKKVGLKPNRLPLLAVGLALYFALSAIPIFGSALAFASMVFGLGAGVLTQARSIQNDLARD